MEDKFYMDLWLKRILAGICIITYFFLYLTLLCGKRIRRRTYWLQCHVAISAIIRCFCVFVAGFYYQQLMGIFHEIPSKDFPDDNDLTQVQFERKHFLDNYRVNLMDTVRKFKEISEFCILTWNTFTLLALYQYYYDLKRPLAVEMFTIRDALLSFAIWIVTMAFCVVIFVSYRNTDGSGYKIFADFETFARGVLTFLHMTSLVVLIFLLRRLQRNGFMVELLPHDQRDLRKAERMLGGEWYAQRKRSFILAYICATGLIVMDILELVCFVYAKINGASLFDPVLPILDQTARWMWYLEAITWPCLWLIMDHALRKKVKKYWWLENKVIMWARGKEKESEKDEAGVIVIKTISN